MKEMKENNRRFEANEVIDLAIVLVGTWVEGSSSFGSLIVSKISH